MKNKKIAFIGAGNLAEALIRGVLKAGLFQCRNIIASDVREEKLEELRKQYGISTFYSNTEAVEKADIVILAVKPQIIQEVLKDIAQMAIDDSKLIISVAAGVPISVITLSLTEGGGKNPRIVRVMPNAPALVQEGAAALAGGAHTSESDMKAALEIFNAVGKTVVVEESLMDAVTGLSGSGPAYVCAMLESLSDAGVKVGLPRDVSSRLSLQTVLGTARLLEETGKQPSELRKMVTSPGGTTVCGLQALERGRFKDTVINAVEAATARAKELGRPAGSG